MVKYNIYIYIIYLTWTAILRLQAQHRETRTVKAVVIAVFLQASVWTHWRLWFFRVELRRTELGVHTILVTHVTGL